jgi:uncharacterized protein (DUF302 family)
MENLELNFQLTVAQVNTVLKYLGGGVYAEVADLITLLHNQAKPQIENAAIAGVVAPEASDNE